MDTPLMARLLHGLVVGLLIAGTYVVLQQLSFFRQASRLAQALILGVSVFVLTGLLYVLWP